MATTVQNLGRTSHRADVTDIVCYLDLTNNELTAQRATVGTPGMRYFEMGAEDAEDFREGCTRASTSFGEFRLVGKPETKKMWDLDNAYLRSARDFKITRYERVRQVPVSDAVRSAA